MVTDLWGNSELRYLPYMEMEQLPTLSFLAAETDVIKHSLGLIQDS